VPTRPFSVDQLSLELVTRDDIATAFALDDDFATARIRLIP
jgi:hypothetical protein